jgi:hypothetical protein
VLRTLSRPYRHRLPYVLYGYANGDGERLRRSQIAADAALGFVLECLNPWQTGGSPGAALHQMFSILLPDALWATTPDQTALPTISVTYATVRLPPHRLCHLRDGALVLVLAALDDGALDLTLSLRDCDLGTVLLTLESDRPGLANGAAHEMRAALQAALQPLDITIQTEATDWSWRSTLTVPATAHLNGGRS